MRLDTILQKYNINKDIEYIIEEYLYDFIEHKKQHKNNLSESLLIINKNWKFVSIFNNGKICEECYMQSYVNKTSYIDNNYCDLCKFRKNEILGYLLINYETFIQTQEIKNYNFRNIFYYYKDKYYNNLSSELLYEIRKGPIFWTKKQKNIKVLFRYY